MIYMTRIQNMSFFLLKVNNPSVRHPVGHPLWPPSGIPSGPVWPSVWPPRLATRRAPVGHPIRPRLAPRLATPSGHPVRPPLGRKKNKNKNKKFLGCCCRLEKRAKNISVFGFQSPRSPSSPSSPSSAGEAARRRRFFWPSSPSHPSELYSSPRWLNSKVPKPFLMLMASRVGTLWSLGNLIDLELNLCSIESNEGVTTNIIIIAPTLYLRSSMFTKS
jgi:hypothetical protein